jgi:hypothetical protein
MSWELEQTGSKDSGPCDCCGDNSRTVWGFLHRDGRTEAAYFVQWTQGQVDRHGAHFDFIVGPWGEGTNETHRSAISVEFRRTRDGPAFMVVDAETRPVAQSDLASRVLSRAEVVGSPLAALVFEMVDAIWLHDSRIAEIACG